MQPFETKSVVYQLKKKFRHICPITRNLQRIPSPFSSLYKLLLLSLQKGNKNSKFMQRKVTVSNKVHWTYFLPSVRENNSIWLVLNFRDIWKNFSIPLNRTLKFLEDD